MRVVPIETLKKKKKIVASFDEPASPYGASRTG